MKRSWRETKQRFKEVKRLKTEKKIEKQKQEIENNNEVQQQQEQQQQQSSGRHNTTSIALPFSIMDNAQTHELRAYLCGQIARAAAIFKIDEIVIFDEYAKTSKQNNEDAVYLDRRKSLQQMVKILQYLECPQYLRKILFPIQNDLKYAGLLNPLDTFHHLKTNDICNYREGVVTNLPAKNNGCLVDIGLSRKIYIEKCLKPNLRVTVKFDAAQFNNVKKPKGTVVSPSTPRTEAGLYWGYTIRIANSLNSVLKESPYDNGYDLTIGTSEHGLNIDKNIKKIPKKYNHLLIVFGGLKGIEAALEADETLTVNEPKDLFNFYLNTCPNQGSNTIRTEEAILISLSTLRRRLLKL